MGGENDAVLFLGRDGQTHDLRVMRNLMLQIGRLKGHMPEPCYRNQNPLLRQRAQSARLAIRAPSARLLNFSQTMASGTSGTARGVEANPQSALAMTFSRPTTEAKR